MRVMKTKRSIRILNRHGCFIASPFTNWVNDSPDSSTAFGTAEDHHLTWPSFRRPQTRNFKPRVSLGPASGSVGLHRDDPQGKGFEPRDRDGKRVDQEAGPGQLIKVRQVLDQRDAFGE